jgi:membrane protease YdiL (CAAX protease family)
MTSVTFFLVGVGVTLLASFCAVSYLKPFLKQILTELCGTPDRANFWAAFSDLTLILMPLIFALHSRSAGEPQTPLVIQLGAQIEWALIGLVATVLLLGFVISRFIPRPGQTLVSPAGGQEYRGARRLGDAKAEVKAPVRGGAS